MRFITAFFCLLIFTFTLFAQKPDEVLATANNQKFTVKDLSPEARKFLKICRKQSANFANRCLNSKLPKLCLKPKRRRGKLTVEKLIETEVTKKVAAPTEKEIQAIYDANRNEFGGKTIEEVRPQIVAFLRREPEQKALAEYLSDLKVKYKVALGKDINAPNLKPFDVLATVNGKTISVENFEAKNKLRLYEFQADIYDQIQELLKQTVFENCNRGGSQNAKHRSQRFNRPRNYR